MGRGVLFQCFSDTLHTLERKLSKMTDKLTEIWLTDKNIKDQSLKPDSYDILASGKIVWVPKRPKWAIE